MNLKMLLNNWGTKEIELYKVENVLGDFRLEIVLNEDVYEYWIYENTYGVKMLMYGIKEYELPCDEDIYQAIENYHMEYMQE